MPDSPKFLLAKKQTAEAQKALQWFRGSQVDINSELKDMMRANEEEAQIGNISFKDLFSQKVYLQPFLIAMFVMFGQQFCGINVVFFYLVTIFEKTKSSIDSSKISTFHD